MSLLRWALLLIVSHLNYSESGGHGGKKHDIIKIHIPEIINHERHTKHVTIHHHHPSKKEHHHHHHHHSKPQLPKHWDFHEKKIHKSHSHGSEHYGGSTSHSHGHKEHGHDHHIHKHHEPEHHSHPEVSHDYHYTPVSHDYTPPQHKYTPHDYTPFKHEYTPPQHSYVSTQHEYTPPQIHNTDISGTPKLYGVKHTFKQVQFFDSIKPVSGSNIHTGKGYQVTEQSEDEDEGNGINSFVGSKYQPIFGSDFGYTAQLSSDNENDPFAAILAQNVMKEQNVATEPLEYDPSPKDTEFEYSEGEPFSAIHPSQSFSAIEGQDEHKDSTLTGFSEYPFHENHQINE